ncbi:hypothetical protein OGAPHI_004873 [Ogataea philodendri]|uniref:RNA polymerase II assembly factor Rtp1 C-terminal domain-containing protein n=1 Tax=Ogataea philodendri TaxID=1378263 RepID=A0A9P8T3G4_9ASCO|nr:uncharacterized protein OGAPHI_004873 [Ogataea philodendri]KAH3664159.1 hypothetical protein OGAPHI_004873 [Ogataea philodendri]
MSSSDTNPNDTITDQQQENRNVKSIDLEQVKQSLKGFKPDPTYVRKRTTPLGKLFEEISNFIEDVSEEDPIKQLYSKLDNKDSNDDPVKQREKVIDQLLSYLLKIHNLVPRNNQTDLIAIPLYDMKIVSQIVNIIVVQGVYASIPPGIGFPLAKRRLKNFKIPLRISKIPYPKGQTILKHVVDTFETIYKGDSDLKNLVLVGTGYTDSLTCCILLAKDDPHYREVFKFLESISSAYQLFSLYSVVVTQQLQPWFKQFIMTRLSDLIVERTHNGVQSLIEVVMGLRESESVDVTKIDEVLKVLLSSRPSQLSKAEYLQIVGDQLYNILVYVNRPILISVVTQLLELLYSKNPLIVRDFIFKKVWNIFNPDLRGEADDEDIMLSSEVEVNNAFNVVISITRTSGNEAFTRELFEPITVPLWAYLLHQKRKDKDCKLIEKVFVLVLSRPDDKHTILNILVDNLMVTHGRTWEFDLGDNELTYIKERLGSSGKVDLLDSMDFSTQEFRAILQTVAEIDESQVQYVFLKCLKGWLNSDEKYLVKEDENPFTGLINLKVLEMLSETFKESLLKSVDDTLEFLYTVLKDETKVKETDLNIIKEEDSDDEPEENSENFKILFELLSTIITDTKLSSKSLSILKQIENVLKPINVPLAKRVETILRESKNNPAPVAEANQELETRQKAMKSLLDNSPPIRVHGLQLLRKLVELNSPVVSLDFAVNQHLMQFKDPEPFVYLNAIRGLEELLQFDSQLITKYVKIYGDNKKNLDDRLKLGEVILRFINFSSEALKYAEEITTKIMSIVRTDSKEEISMRMSAMSLLGSLCHRAPLSILKYLDDIMDCVFGILQLETSNEEAVMRRSAIVLVSDIVSTKDSLHTLGKYGQKLDVVLKYTSDNDNDYLVREQAMSVLSLIDDKFAETFRDTIKTH